MCRPDFTRLRGPGGRSVLNAALETGPQDSAPSGATESPPEAEENHGLRVGQMKVSKVGRFRLSNATPAAARDSGSRESEKSTNAHASWRSVA